MNEQQEARKRFINEIPVFAETKTPPLLSLKLLEEVGEFLVSFTEYARSEKSPDKLKAVRDESADIVNILFDVAIFCGFDLGTAVNEKLQKDKKRFPPETMVRLYPQEPAHQVYMRRKRQLRER